MKSALIIGSGIAGLSTAYHLSKAGIKVHILESSKNLGGRLTAFFDSNSEETIENGQHALMSAYCNFLEIIENFDISNYINFQNHLKVEFFDTKGKNSTLNCGYLPGKFGFILGFLLLNGISYNSKKSIFGLIKVIEKNNLNINDLTCFEFLKQHNQSSEAISRFWEPFIIATMNSDVNIASARIFCNIVKKAFINDINNSKLGFANIDYQTILNRILQNLAKNGVKISYDSKVEKLEIQNNKIAGVHTKNAFYQADFVISTLQPFSLINIIPNEYLERFSYLNKFQYSPIISIYFWQNEKLFDNDFVSVLNSPIQWIFNRRKLIKKEQNFKYKESYSITISSAYEFMRMKKEELMDIIYNELSKLFPKFDKSKILHSRIIYEKFATILQSPEINQLRPNTITCIDNFFLAGDWTKTFLPATIESAALSGKLVLENII